MYYCGNLHYEKFSDGSVKCIEDEIPFELPDGWAWARLGTVVTFVGGYAYKSNRYVQHSNNLLIRIGNVKNNSLTPHVAKTCISDEYAAETSGYNKCCTVQVRYLQNAFREYRSNQTYPNGH